MSDTPRSGRPWAIGIAALYAVFAAGVIGIVAIAMNQRYDLVSDEYYQESLRQDDKAAALQRGAEAFRDLAYRKDEGAIVLEVSSADAAGDDSVEVRFYRPSDKYSDRSSRTAFSAPGTVRIPTAGYAAGVWKVSFRWKGPRGEYLVERKLSL